MKLSFAEYFKAQLADCVDCYRLYFKKTYSVAVLFSVMSLLGIAILFVYSSFDILNRPEKVSLLSYFFGRYNTSDAYVLIDLSRIWFLLCVSLFSVGLWRLQKSDLKVPELSLGFFVKQIRPQDLFVLSGAAILCSIFDYCLNLLSSYVYGIESGKMDLVYWMHFMLSQIRTYLPLLVFAYSINGVMNTAGSLKILPGAVYLLAPLWLLNAVVYDFVFSLRALVISPLLTPFGSENRLIYESILAVGLISFCFLVFYAVLTGLFRVQEQKNGVDKAVAEL